MNLFEFFIYKFIIMHHEGVIFSIAFPFKPLLILTKLIPFLRKSMILIISLIPDTLMKQNKLFQYSLR